MVHKKVNPREATTPSLKEFFVSRSRLLLKSATELQLQTACTVKLQLEEEEEAISIENKHILLTYPGLAYNWAVTPGNYYTN